MISSDAPDDEIVVYNGIYQPLAFLIPFCPILVVLGVRVGYIFSYVCGLVELFGLGFTIDVKSMSPLDTRKLSSFSVRAGRSRGLWA